MQVTIAQATSKAQNTLTRISFFYQLPIKLIKKFNILTLLKFLVTFNDFQEQN